MKQTKSQRMSPRATLARKDRLGVSYRSIGERIGVSHETIRLVLLERKSGLQIDRDRVLRDTNVALDEIEAEQKAHAA